MGLGRREDAVSKGIGKDFRVFLEGGGEIIIVYTVVRKRKWKY